MTSDIPKKNLGVAGIVLALLVAASVHGQVDPNWSSEQVLPALSSATDVDLWVGPNMVITSDDRIFLAYSDDQATDNRIQILFSPDKGTTWGPPYAFPPGDSVIGANNVNLVIDTLDNIHAVFNAHSPAGLYYARRDGATDTWSAPVQLDSSSAVESPTLTVDRALRVHVFWHDGRLATGSDSAEVWYDRSPDNGASFDTPQMLSADDSLPSAFPRADFSGTASDTLAVAWRDSVGGSAEWDVIAAVTTDGGETWSRMTAAGGVNSQWDPGIVVDRHGAFHLNYHEYGYVKIRIRYQKSTDQGTTWSSPITLSDPTLHSQLTIFAYSYDTDLQWILWKSLRGSSYDIAGSFTADGGEHWSLPEYATDLAPSSVGYKKCTLARDGTLLIDYEYPPLPGGRSRLFFRSRDLTLTGVGGAPIPFSELPTLRLAPEPARSRVNAVIRLESAGRVRLRIFDVLGREVSRAFDAFLPEGDQLVPIDISSLASGVYFCRLDAGSIRAATKLHVVR